MGWSKSSLRDPIRKKKVADTLEERVRQHLIAHMTGPLGFPKGLISVEKNLSAFCPSICKSLERRLDLIAFYQEKERLLPLLLVECKKDASLMQEAKNQVIGYNEWILAPFIAVAFPDQVKMFWKEKEEIRHISFIPSYLELVSACKKQFVVSK